eukprot:CAMPEP_0198578320 /NCGR_PEP_ID=MMETSP1462-20131121/120089_1 /TAXON_ID=1333877 /ORGANISM="Brandtodinium nutriculum, Strain RCC3387" /LENGTH=132 /DNA_ID=CAMNT_0044309615 /DNA_START=155 /DNA_END=549 /DNA_ORIENTATION=-
MCGMRRPISFASATVRALQYSLKFFHLLVPNLYGLSRLYLIRVVVSERKRVQQDPARPDVVNVLDQPNVRLGLLEALAPDAALEDQGVRLAVHEQGHVGVPHGLVDHRRAIDARAEPLAVARALRAAADLEA